MSKTPTIRLHTPSQRRRDFYAKWRLERQLERQLKPLQVSDVSQEDASWQIAATPYNRHVEEGDIRLLPATLTADSNALTYLAILHVRDNGTAVVAPFSRYATPCCKDEWLTGVTAVPLQVLQLWNTMPLPILMLAQSWCTGHLSEQQLRDAQQLYTHFLQGTLPKGELRENIGLTITSPGDERLQYQEEEYQRLSRLREKLFNFTAS